MLRNASLREDLDVYLAHEQVKSAIVDTVGYSRAFVDPSYAPEPADRVDPRFVEATLRAWAARTQLQP